MEWANNAVNFLNASTEDIQAKCDSQGVGGQAEKKSIKDGRIQSTPRSPMKFPKKQ